MARATARWKDGREIEYYLEDRLKNNLDEKVIPDLQKRDKDCFLVVDGGEGKGKSTFAMQLGKYVDPSLDLSRVVFDPEDFRQAVLKAKKGQCVIYDEAFTGLSSRASLSMVNKVLISLTMQMRQKNLLVIIVLPTIFLLDKYIALFRARALIHVHENKGVRGYFKLYNSRVKKTLFLEGAKTYSYFHKRIKTRFRGRFYGKFVLGDSSVEAEYRKKKEKALEQSEKNPMTNQQVKFKQQRDLLVWRLKNELKLSNRKLENYLEQFDFGMNFRQIGLICTNFGDKEEKEELEVKKKEAFESEKKMKLLENLEEEPENEELPLEIDEKDLKEEDFDGEDSEDI